jgi:hypothetical protein
MEWVEGGDLEEVEGEDLEEVEGGDLEEVEGGWNEFERKFREIPKSFILLELNQLIHGKKH